MSTQSRIVVSPIVSVVVAASFAAAALPPDVRFLPGDLQLDVAGALQRDAFVAPGGDLTLVVWSDYRTSPDNGPPSSTDGGGSDIYAVRVDGTGTSLDPIPLIVNADAGDQYSPQAAWNGSHWLVTWAGINRSGFSVLAGVRLAADGTIVGAPFRILSGSSTNNYELVSNGSTWLVGHQLGTTARAVRIAADGTVLDPGGVELLNVAQLSGFEIESAGGEYLLAWSTFSTRNGLRINANLEPIGSSFTLPDTHVGSNGSDYFLTWWSGGSLVGSRMSPDGTLADPAGIPITPGTSVITAEPGIAWDGLQWWFSWVHVFDGIKVARAAPDGTVLDFGGTPIDLASEPFMTEPAVGGLPGGGALFAWKDYRAGGSFSEDIYAARVTAGGHPEPVAALSLGLASQRFVDLAAGDGQLLAVFRRDVAGSRTIVGQRIDAGGEALDLDPFPLGGGVWTGAPRVAWNGTVYLVVWSDLGGAVARRVEPNGTVLDATPIDLGPLATPDVAALGDTFLVAATKATSSTQFYVPVSLRVDGTTGAVLDPQPLMLGAFFARAPRVTAVDGRWLVTWQRNFSHDDPQANARAAFVEPDGTSPGDFLVDFNSFTPYPAFSGNEVLFAMRRNSPSNANNDVIARRMLPDGSFPEASIVVSAGAGRQVDPAVTWNGNEFVMVWGDERNRNGYWDEREEVFGARIDAAGTLVDPAGFSFAGPTRPELDPAVESINGTVVVAASLFVDDPAIRAYRVGYDLLGDEAPGNRWPVAVTSAVPTSGEVPLPVDFDSTGSFDPDGAIVGVDWDFGDGAIAQGANRIHTYDEAGDYLAQMRVVDELGAGTTQSTLVRTFRPNLAPVAVASASTPSGDAPLTVIHYAGGSYDPEGTITTYWWDFGDGGGSFNQTAYHTYPSSGVYETMLTVTDDDFVTATATITIWVGESPGPGECPDGASVPGVPLMLGKVAGGAAMTLNWGSSCAAANDYAIYEGSIGSWTSHQPVCCTTAGATFRTVIASPGSSYYLVAPTDGNAEGSYGTDSAGVDRTQSASACLPQIVNGTCRN